MGAGGARLSPVNAPHLVLLVGVGVGSSFSPDQFGLAAPQHGHTETVWERMGKKEQEADQRAEAMSQVSKQRSVVVPVYGVRPGRTPWQGLSPPGRTLCGSPSLEGKAWLGWVLWGGC